MYNDIWVMNDYEPVANHMYDFEMSHYIKLVNYNKSI